MEETYTEEYVRLDEQIVTGFLQTKENLSEISDLSLQDIDEENMKRHSELYTALLNTYVDNVALALAKKRQLKEEFYDVCKGIMNFTCAMFFIIFFLMMTGVIPIDSISVLVGTIVSFLTVFIVIPHTVAKYLFNNEEEKYMTEIIKSVQEHDVEIRRGMK